MSGKTASGGASMRVERRTQNALGREAAYARTPPTAAARMARVVSIFFLEVVRGFRTYDERPLGRSTWPRRILASRDAAGGGTTRLRAGRSRRDPTSNACEQAAHASTVISFVSCPSMWLVDCAP